MTAKKKPVVVKPILVAVDNLYWRARIVSEFLEGYVEQLSEHANLAVLKLTEALADYEASRDATHQPSTPSDPPKGSNNEHQS